MKLVSFYTEQSKYHFRGKTLMRMIAQKIVEDKYQRTLGNIAVVFCADDYVLQLNKKYLKHNYYTDVITFDDCKPPVVSGDIFISVGVVRKNATIYGVTFTEELNRVIIHGILHLCGEKDSTPEEQKQMRAAEDEFLAILATMK